MQIRKKDYSDILLEAYLAEAGYNPVVVSANDQKQAEAAFTAELTNGPKQRVTYASGKSFMVPVGTFDLENFHKAYDQYFDDHGILGLFDSSGLLVNRGMYGQIKNLNSNDPAVKALYKLWGTQFKGDMQFTNSNTGATANNSSVNSSSNSSTVTHISASSISTDPIASAVWNTIIQLPEFAELEAAYNGNYGNIAASFDIEADSDTIYKIIIQLSGVLVPLKGNFKDAYKLDLLTIGSVPRSEFVDCLSGKATSIIISVSTSAIADYKKKLADWLKNLLLIYKGCEFTLANAAAFDSTAFGEIYNKLSFKITDTLISTTAVVFNKKDFKYYFVKPVHFTNNPNPYSHYIDVTTTGLILVDAETDTNVNIPISADLVPAILIKNGPCGPKEPNYFYNSWVPDDILKKFNVKTPNVAFSRLVPAPNNLCAQYFDVILHA